MVRFSVGTMIRLKAEFASDHPAFVDRTFVVKACEHTTQLTLLDVIYIRDVLNGHTYHISSQFFEEA